MLPQLFGTCIFYVFENHKLGDMGEDQNDNLSNNNYSSNMKLFHNVIIKNM